MEATANSRSKIGSSVDTQLEQTTEKLLSGSIQLHDCAPGIQALYMAGFVAGTDSKTGAIERLTWERDLYYWLACNPAKNADDFYKHLTSALWDGATS